MSNFVDHSPWPFYISISFITLITANSLVFPIVTFFFILYLWFRDIIRESKQGYHTILIQKGLRLSFIIFLITEVMLFFCFFWAFFHSSLSPSISIGLFWPPINTIQYTSIPLLGSLLLLSSGFYLTLSHHAFLIRNKFFCLIHGLFSLLLGSSFALLQFIEYSSSDFTISDSIFGSVFYMTTGLHGLHVIFGIIFLAINYFRIFFDHFTLEHHLGFQLSIFYYHFVDIIWFFLFFFFYFWGFSPLAKNLFHIFGICLNGIKRRSKVGKTQEK